VAARRPSRRTKAQVHPRADQMPSEKNQTNPNDALAKENAILDSKIKSICRGC
jgi:hypothetical protein